MILARTHRRATVSILALAALVLALATPAQHASAADRAREPEHLMPRINRHAATIDPVIERALAKDPPRGALAIVTAWTRAELDDVEALGVRGVRMRVLPMLVTPRLTRAQLDDLRASPAVRSVWAEHRYPLTMADSTWITKARQTWRAVAEGGLGIDGTGAEVAVIDTGIDGTHQDADNLIEFCEVTGAIDRAAAACSPFNPASGNLGPAGPHNDARLDAADDGGHGSHVSGTIAGTGDGGGGRTASHSNTGMAPGARLHVYSSGGGLSVSLIGAATAYDDMVFKKQNGLGNVVAVNNSYGDDTPNADVIYMPDTPLEVAVQVAYQNGIVSMFAAGNSGPGHDSVSSNCVSPWVLCVAATTKADSIADFSSRGLPSEPADTNGNGVVGGSGDETPRNHDRRLGQALTIGVYRPSISAPGSDIVSIFAGASGCREGGAPGGDGCYTTNSGTSMATPHVVGAAALVVQAYRAAHGASPSAGTVIEILERSAALNKLPGYEAEEQGAGRLNVAEAVRLAGTYPDGLPPLRLGQPTPPYAVHPGAKQSILNERGCTSPSSAVVERDPNTGEPRFGQHTFDVPPAVERMIVTWDFPELENSSLLVAGATIRLWEPGVDPDGSSRAPGPLHTFNHVGSEIDLRSPKPGRWTLRFYTTAESNPEPCRPDSREDPKQTTGFNYILNAVVTKVASSPSAAVTSPADGAAVSGATVPAAGTAAYPARWDGITSWEVSSTQLAGEGTPIDPGTVTPTTVYLDGNIEDGCSGDGRTDLVQCDGPFLKLGSERTLSPSTAASWNVPNPAVDGSAPRNVHDPNWIWRLSGLTKLQGDMTLTFWAGCPGCSVDAQWTVRVFGDGILKFSQNVGGVTALPSVPDKLTATVELPFMQASNNYVVQIDPFFIDAQANTSIYYDSAQPCPGAQTTEACDSFLVMPVTTASPPPPGPQPPTLLRTTDVHEGGLRLAWTASAGATQYEVYRTTDPAERPSAATLITTVGGSACNSPDVPTWPTASRSGLCYTDASAAPDVIYYYRLKALDASGGRSRSSLMAQGIATVYDRSVRVSADRPYGQGVAEYASLGAADGTSWTHSWETLEVLPGVHAIGARSYTQGVGSAQASVSADLEAGAEITVDCGAESDDIASVQQAVDFPSPNGVIVRLRGTCDFSSAAAHGGDLTSIEATAVMIRNPNVTIESAGDPQSATVLGSGTQTAFTVVPGVQGTTIRGLRLVSLGRPIVVIDAVDTMIGGANPGEVPSMLANRIIGHATMDSSILGIATDRGFGDPSGQLSLRYGPGGAGETFFLISPSMRLTGLRVIGNYISYNPPGLPDGDTHDTVAIDVRQRFSRVVDGVRIQNNAVGYFSSEFPSFNTNAVRIHALTSDKLAPTPDGYYIRNVIVSDNNLGRLEELDNLPPDDVNAGDVHAGGRAAIVFMRVSNFEANYNGVRSRLSPTGAIAMPGGGIVAGDSSDGEIKGNGIVVVADPSTLSSDLGAVGLVDDLLTLFNGATGPPTERIRVTDNIVGTVGSDTPGIGAQRGLLLNGASHVTLGRNEIKFSSSSALNIGVAVTGPGNGVTPRTLAGAVLGAVACQNRLDGTMDNVNEVNFNISAGNSGDAFPSGGNYQGNLNCTPLIQLSPASVGAGGSLTATGRAWSARPVRVRLTGPPAGTEIVRDLAAAADGSFTTTFSASELSAFDDGALCATATASDDLPTGLTSTSDPSCAFKSVTAPDAPSINTPAEGAVLGSASVSVSGTAAPGSTVSVSEGATEIGTASADAGGAWATVISFADGVHVITATATDAGGTSPPSAPRTFTVDTVAPAAPSITSPADGALLASSSVTVAGTAEASATVAIFEGATQVGTAAAAAADGTWSVAITFSDGSHTITATATDAAGNQSVPSSPVTFTVDTTAPLAPVITTPADGAVLASSSVSVGGTAEAGSTVRVYEGLLEIGTATTDGGGAWSVSITFADGSHTIEATATDVAGNTGPSSAPVGFTVDTAAPAAPVITTPVDGSTVTSTLVTVGGTAEPNAAVEVRESGSGIGTTSADGSGQWSVGIAFADGSHTIAAVATDGAGNVSAPSAPVTFTVDSAAPATPSITQPADGSLLATAAVTVAGTADAGSLIAVREGGSTIGTATTDGAGAWSVSITFADGSHTIDATASDGAGNTSAPSAAVTFTVDTAAPAAPVITAPANGSTIGSAIVAIAGTAEPGSDVEVSEGGSAVATATADGAGNWSASATFADGSHTITATATDGAGNVSAPSAPVTFTVDTAAPGAPVITSPADGSLLASASVGVAGTAEAGSTVRVYEGAAQVGEAQAQLDGSWSVSITFADGGHTITATATDGAGNTSPASSPVSFTVDTAAPGAPSITTPASGAVVGTNLVPVSGTAEASSTVRVFEGVAQIGETPAQPDGSWSVAIAFADGSHTITATATDAAGNTSPASAPRSFVVDTTGPAAPSITTPPEGAVLTSGTVTVSGTAEALATVTILEGVQIGQAPASASGDWSLSLTFADGSHTITATATDAAGNTGPASAPRTFVIDPTATGIHPFATILSPAAFTVLNGTTTATARWQEPAAGEPVKGYWLIVGRPNDFSRVYARRILKSAEPGVCGAGVCSVDLAFPLATPGGPLAADDKYALGVVSIFNDGHRSDARCDDGTAFGAICGANLSHSPGYGYTEFLITSRTWGRVYTDPATHDALLIDDGTGDFEFVNWLPRRPAAIFRGTALIIPTGFGTQMLFGSAGDDLAIAGTFGEEEALAIGLRLAEYPPRVHLFNGERQE